MTGKRKLGVYAYEVGESSHSHHSRRLSQIMGYSYIDNGDCDCVCEHCGALFWYEERVAHGSTNSTTKYTQCCKSGSVPLPFPLEPPPVLKQLFSDADFMENIRAYNNMFSMTSFGAQIDDSINDGRGPYVFKVSGQVSHWIGSLCPEDESPRFLQLYIHDTTNEVPNRLRFFNSSDHRNLSEVVVKQLSDTLNSCNEYARMFKNAIQMCGTSSNCEFSVRLYSNVGDRRYKPPATGTLGGIIRGNDSNASKYDIVIQSKEGVTS